MSKAILVCSKCGRTEEFDAAIAFGWLHAQRKGAPEGYLVIRCSKHITAHALRLAGLPQQVTSKRVTDNLEFGLYADYGDGYTASVWYDLGGAAQSVDELGDPDLGAYVIQYHKGEFPPFRTLRFHTIEALIQTMRNVQPDLRKWRLHTV